MAQAHEALNVGYIVDPNLNMGWLRVRMKMPMNCGGCPFLGYYAPANMHFCEASAKTWSGRARHIPDDDDRDKSHLCRGERPDWCPLEEISVTEEESSPSKSPPSAPAPFGLRSAVVRALGELGELEDYVGDCNLDRPPTLDGAQVQYRVHHAAKVLKDALLLEAAGERGGGGR